VSGHFRRSYLKANKVSKSEETVKVESLYMHIISESVLMLFTQNYDNQSMINETTACQSWLIFKRLTLL